MHNMSDYEADGPKQQKTMPGSTSVSQEQKAETAVGTGSPKLTHLLMATSSMITHPCQKAKVVSNWFHGKYENLGCVLDPV